MPTVNGYDTAAMQEAVSGLQQQPAAAKVTFRGRTIWESGPAVHQRHEQMEQAGQVTPRDFTSRGDHPPALLGKDTGPTAGEALLAALGACITATYTAHATARGVTLEALEVSVEGDLDLHGFFQLDGTRAGFQGITATISVRSDADDGVLEEIRQVMTTASPVHDSVGRGVPITSAVSRMA